MPSQFIKIITTRILQPFMSFSLPIRLQSTKKEADPAMAPVVATPVGATDEGVVKSRWAVVHAKFEANYGLDFGNSITRQKYKEVYEEFWQGKVSDNESKEVKTEEVKDVIVVALSSPTKTKKRVRESDDSESDADEAQSDIEQTPQKKQKVAGDDESDCSEDDEDLFDAENYRYIPEACLEEDSTDEDFLDEEALDEDSLLNDEENEKVEDEDEGCDSGYDS